MWESRVRCEISKSLWEPFCGFHRDGISTAVFAVVVLAREFGGCATLADRPLVAPGASCAVVLIGRSPPAGHFTEDRVATTHAAGSDPIRRPCHAGVNRPAPDTPASAQPPAASRRAGGSPPELVREQGGSRLSRFFWRRNRSPSSRGDPVPVGALENLEGHRRRIVARSHLTHINGKRRTLALDYPFCLDEIEDGRRGACGRAYCGVLS